MNIIFVTLMFGTSMPILFPIAFISFVLIYCQENIMLMKVYKKPAMHDQSLHSKVLDTL